MEEKSPHNGKRKKHKQKGDEMSSVMSIPVIGGSITISSTTVKSDKPSDKKGAIKALGD